MTMNPAATLRTLFALLVLPLFLTACASTGSNSSSLLPTETAEYRIGPSDVLSISIWNKENMDRTVTVRPDGMISFPLLNEVRAEGLTPTALAELLTVSLRDYMEVLEGELTVVVDEVHSYTVSVLGEVRTPGRYEFNNNATVLDALALAGGLTEFASGSKIQIIRNEPTGRRTINFDYNDLVSARATNMQLGVYPGDIVLVP
ncbi:MAG: polysaccharide biosynthesis/export family protein [Pseudomonadota bacterium]